MKKFIKEWLGYIIVVTVIILVRTYVITPVRVSGNSMNNTLKNGDIMLLYKLADIKRNNIVVINKKVAGDTIIKRVIALPGETIRCTDGIIYVNEKKYNDKYAYGETSDFELVRLKKDEYFVLGDNRLISNDSRYLGPIKGKYIKGKTNIVVFPFSKIGKVK